MLNIRLKDDTRMNSCNYVGCKKQAEYCICVSDGGKGGFLHWYCEEHLSQFKEEFDTAYNNIEELIDLQKKQKEELDIKKEELFRMNDE